MTVESIARKAGPYEFTEGASYPFYFKIFEKTDVYVVVTDDTGVETTIEADTDYRVVMNENQDSDAGGYVTLLKDYTGSKITISSQVSYDQGVNITNKGGFYPSTLNKAYDKLTILCQQLLEQVSRCIKVNISSGVSADEYKDELEGLVNQSVSSAASAAASAQQAATDSAQAVSDSATALSQSTTALSQSTDAVNSIQPALSAAQQASNDAAEAVTKSEQALAETAAIDSKVEQAVNDAISGVTIPGLSKETITGALGYTPYDGETNSQDFATNAEVAGAIAAIPEQVNADWNASKGAAAILNKPTLSAVATSGNYADLQNKPVAMTGATAEAAGTSGFVPAPSAGDENKVLKGDGTWGEVDLGGIVTELNGKADKDLSNISENIAYIVDSYHDDEGNWYRKWSDGWVEQGGLIKKGGTYTGQIQITFLCPLSKIITLNRTNVSAYSSTVITNNFWYSFESISNTGFMFSIDERYADSYWYVAGIGAE